MSEHEDQGHDHEDRGPDTARASALPPSNPMKKTPSIPPIPPGALDDAPPWALAILGRFDESQKTTRQHVTHTFDQVRLELLGKIAAVEQKHEELARRVRRDDVTRVAAPFVGIALGAAAFLLAVVALVFRK